MINLETVIIVISALLAGVTFIGLALPFLQKSEQKSKYKELIKNRRQNLYQEVKESMESNTAQVKKDGSAREDVALFFKVERIIGATAGKIRNKLQQAGYRGPKAPLVFMTLKLILPVVFAFIGFLYTSKAEDVTDLMSVGIILGAFIVGFKLPDIIVKNQTDKRQLEINQVFPDALDMMLVCVQGGISIEQAIVRISDEIADQSPILAEELGLLSAELGLLNDRRKAFQDFATRVGSGAAKSFGMAMIQAEKYGTSISKAIRVMADELRDMRMAEAERKAAALPPKLTVPMIMFFLPSLFVVILGPAIIDVMSK